MVSLSVRGTVSGLKATLPIVAGGVLGEFAQQYLPFDEYAKKIPVIGGFPLAARFAPAVLAWVATIILFGVNAITGKGWTITNLLGGAFMGISINLMAKAVRKGI